MKNEPLLYYRTKEQIEAYRKEPAGKKLERIEAWMEFYNTVMTKKAKSIRDRFKKGKI